MSNGNQASINDAAVQGIVGAPPPAVAPAPSAPAGAGPTPQAGAAASHPDDVLHISQIDPQKLADMQHKHGIGHTLKGLADVLGGNRISYIDPATNQPVYQQLSPGQKWGNILAGLITGAMVGGAQRGPTADPMGAGFQVMQEQRKVEKEAALKAGLARTQAQKDAAFLTKSATEQIIAMKGTHNPAELQEWARKHQELEDEGVKQKLEAGRQSHEESVLKFNQAQQEMADRFSSTPGLGVMMVSTLADLQRKFPEIAKNGQLFMALPDDEKDPSKPLGFTGRLDLFRRLKTDEPVPVLRWDLNKDGTGLVSRVATIPAGSTWYDVYQAHQAGVSDYVRFSQESGTALTNQAKAAEAREKTGDYALYIRSGAKDKGISFDEWKTQRGAAAKKIGEEEAAAPDVAAAAKLIVGNDLAQIRDISSFRGNQRLQLFNAIAEEAKRQGKNPHDFSPARMEAKAKTLIDFTEGKKADQITAFNTFLGHANDAMSVNETWRRTGSNLVNRPLNWLAKNAKDDTNYQAFITSLEPVRKEFMSFLNANRAEMEADVRVMQNVLSDESSPARIEAALKQLGQSANIRLRALSDQFQRSIGQSYQSYTGNSMYSESSQQTLRRMGISSGIQVRDPRGGVHTFPDQVSADRFKKAAGIP